MCAVHRSCDSHLLLREVELASRIGHKPIVQINRCHGARAKALSEAHVLDAVPQGMDLPQPIHAPLRLETYLHEVQVRFAQRRLHGSWLKFR